MRRDKAMDGEAKLEHRLRFFISIKVAQWLHRSVPMVEEEADGWRSTEAENCGGYYTERGWFTECERIENRPAREKRTWFTNDFAWLPLL